MLEAIAVKLKMRQRYENKISYANITRKYDLNSFSLNK